MPTDSQTRVVVDTAASHGSLTAYARLRVGVSTALATHAICQKHGNPVVEGIAFVRTALQEVASPGVNGAHGVAGSHDPGVLAPATHVQFGVAHAPWVAYPAHVAANVAVHDDVLHAHIPGAAATAFAHVACSSCA